MLEDSVLDRGELELHEIHSPQSVPDLAPEPNARPARPQVEARAPLRPETAEQPGSPTEPEEGQPTTTGKKARKGVHSRRPVIYAVGTMLLAAALGGGYVYLDNAEHFRST